MNAATHTLLPAAGGADRWMDGCIVGPASQTHTHTNKPIRATPHTTAAEEHKPSSEIDLHEVAPEQAVLIPRGRPNLIRPRTRSPCRFIAWWMDGCT